MDRTDRMTHCVNDIAEIKFEHPIPIRVSLVTKISQNDV